MSVLGTAGAHTMTSCAWPACTSVAEAQKFCAPVVFFTHTLVCAGIKYVAPSAELASLARLALAPTRCSGIHVAVAVGGS
jgi:hypothetical protein